jgi:ornithine cyclodeaminase
VKLENIEHAVALQEEGFALYSKGKVTVPPVGYMTFGQDTGEVHLKYGWIEGDDSYVVKLAGAFYQNPVKYKLPTIQPELPELL